MQLQVMRLQIALNLILHMAGPLPCDHRHYCVGKSVISTTDDGCFDDADNYDVW